MTIKPTIVFLVAAALFAGNAFGQRASSAEIKKIDTLGRSIERMTDRSKRPDLVVADTADYDVEKPDWRTFKSIKELDKFRENQETYSIAYNWRSKGKLAASNFTLFSPSGDWTQYVEHYFRPDGSAALIKAELRTFMDDCVIKQKYYVGAKGKILKKKVAYFDLKTNKRKRRCLGADALKFDDYSTVAKLPFASLLK